MNKVKIYPWIFAVIFGIAGIPIGLIVFNLIVGIDYWDTCQKDLGLFIGGAIALGMIIVGIIMINFIIGYSIGESINNRAEIRKKYEDKIKQWEAEGYKVGELKRKWGFQ